MEVLAVIPARGGSKRIPRKNIADFHGKPVIAWAIEAAKGASSVGRVLVNTDDEEIREVALRYGAEVPFLRPAALAHDAMGIEPVLIDTLEWLKTHEGYAPDAIALLMPTNPMRTSEVIDQAVAMFKETGADSVVTVSEARANNNPHWILRKQADGRVTLFDGTPLTGIRTRSQDLPPTYSRNDIAYILKPSNLYQDPPNLYGDKVELLVQDESFDGDINTPEDLAVTYDKFRRLRKVN
ncbi:MAG TPA: acylneuraminate cytidylyltransferase family protein [Candidatus Baltobacteraceae bacterium]|nr:acylneuraminate cytidylyltransferase family protein [Candidatus Baltobacteraceae bacterium]